jgi:hypothetical protein
MGYGLTSLEENEKLGDFGKKEVKCLDKVCQILNICPYKWPNSNKIAIIIILSNLFYNQIYLDPPIDGCQCDYTTKVKKQNHC